MKIQWVKLDYPRQRGTNRVIDRVNRWRFRMAVRKFRRLS